MGAHGSACQECCWTQRSCHDLPLLSISDPGFAQRWLMEPVPSPAIEAEVLPETLPCPGEPLFHLIKHRLLGGWEQRPLHGGVPHAPSTGPRLWLADAIRHTHLPQRTSSYPGTARTSSVFVLSFRSLSCSESTLRTTVSKHTLALLQRVHSTYNSEQAYTVCPAIMQCVHHAE